MAKPSVRRNPGGVWLAACAPPCRAQVRASSWDEAMEHAMRWAARPHRAEWGPTLHAVHADALRLLGEEAAPNG